MKQELKQKLVNWWRETHSSGGDDPEDVREEETTSRKKLHNLIIDLNDSCAWIAVLLPYVFYFFGILIATGVLSHGLWHIRDLSAAGRELDDGNGNVWEAFSSLIFIFSLIFEVIVLSIVIYQYIFVYPERLEKFNSYLRTNFSFRSSKMEQKFSKQGLRRWVVYYQMSFSRYIENFELEEIVER